MEQDKAITVRPDGVGEFRFKGAVITFKTKLTVGEALDIHMSECWNDEGKVRRAMLVDLVQIIMERMCMTIESADKKSAESFTWAGFCRLDDEDVAGSRLGLYLMNNYVLGGAREQAKNA